MTVFHVAFLANSDGSAPIDTVNESVHVTARPMTQLTAGQNPDEIGTYADGLGGYVTSAVFTGSLVGQQMVVLNKADSTKDRVITGYLVAASQLPPQTKVTTFATYLENAADDGKSVQAGLVYYKYSAAY